MNDYKPPPPEWARPRSERLALLRQIRLTALGVSVPLQGLDGVDPYDAYLRGVNAALFAVRDDLDAMIAADAAALATPVSDDTEGAG